MYYSHEKMLIFSGRAQEDETAEEFLEALKKLATEAGLEESSKLYEGRIVSHFIDGVKYPAIRDKLRAMKNTPTLEELGIMCKDTLSVFDRLSKWNIDHVYGKIFLSLDDKSLKNCLKVCQDWRRIIERINPAKPVNGFMIYMKENEGSGLSGKDVRMIWQKFPPLTEQALTEKANCEVRAQEMNKCYMRMYPHRNPNMGNGSPNAKRRKCTGNQASSWDANTDTDEDQAAAVDWMIALMGEGFEYKTLLAPHPPHLAAVGLKLHIKKVLNMPQSPEQAMEVQRILKDNPALSQE